MKSLKSLLLASSLTSLLFVVSCGSRSNTSVIKDSNSNPATEPDLQKSSSEKAMKDNEDGQKSNSDEPEGSSKDSHTHESKGGQVIESGEYHLEFLREEEGNGNHLHLILQKGDDHQTVTNAIVKAQIQSPGGEEQQLELKYDEQEKAYTGILNKISAGQHQVKVIAEINGEQVDGRFQF